MIMCVLLCSPVSFHKLQLLLRGHPVSSLCINLQNTVSSDAGIKPCKLFHRITVVILAQGPLHIAFNFTGPEKYFYATITSR